MSKHLRLTVILTMLLTIAYSENILAKKDSKSEANLCNGLAERIETVLVTAEDAFILFKLNTDDGDENYNYKTCEKYEKLHSYLLKTYKSLAEYQADECDGAKVGKMGGENFTPDYLKGHSMISDSMLKCPAPSLRLDN